LIHVYVIYDKVITTSLRW